MKKKIRSLSIAFFAFVQLHAQLIRLLSGTTKGTILVNNSTLKVYPNLFNYKTTIESSTGNFKNSEILLKVNDLLGNVVSVSYLVKENSIILFKESLEAVYTLSPL